MQWFAGSLVDPALQGRQVADRPVGFLHICSGLPAKAALSCILIT